MEKNHPLRESILLAKNWYEKIGHWSDDYFAIKIHNDKKDKYDIAADSHGKEKLHNYLKASIKEIMDSDFNNITNHFELLISDEEKIEFLNGIFAKLEDLIKVFEENFANTDYGQYAVETLKRIDWHLHYKFDDEHFVILNKSIRIEDKAKLRFNINRTQLVHLLVLMKDSNIIDKAYSDYAIAIFASKFFSYLNDEHKYSPLIRIENYIGDIRYSEQYSSVAEKEIKEKIHQSKIIFK